MEYYSRNAEELFLAYTGADPEKVHAGWLSFLPSPGLACDIGAGSGRDASWLAGLGWEVVAIEPCRELREKAKKQSPPSVSWIDDSLPTLKALRATGLRFDLILISAVWMHLTPGQRTHAFRVVSDLLSPQGLLVISLRRSESEIERRERGFHVVQPGELQHQAKQRALVLLKESTQKDALQRGGVSWDTLCFQLPDDGTGSLPLLRHIIVNDNKSSSYKLGLLRTLIRIAEGAPGMVMARTEESVTLPFGIIALYWLKLYMPLLLRYDIRQQPSATAGYRFATADFYALRNTSSFDLRIGARFSGDEARHLTRALAAACQNIRDNPANFTRFPGSDDRVFSCEYGRMPSFGNHVQLDREFLYSFGKFRIPAALWQTMGQYACWLEPAIMNEWVSLMQSWEDLGVRYNSENYYSALAWEDGKRDTSEVRKRVESVRQSGHGLSCTWTNRNITRSRFAVDHCFPWSRWSNNDLWNLVPTTETANSQKADKLPTAELVFSAQERMLGWWQQAYIDGDMAERFFTEAGAALPLLGKEQSDPQRIFDALLVQRQKLKANQQLQEWSGATG